MNDAQRSPAMIAGAFVFARVITFSTGRTLPRTDTKQNARKCRFRPTFRALGA